MTAILEQRVSAAATWSRRIAVFSLVLLVLAGFAHRRGMVATPDFFVLLELVGSLGVAALCLAAFGFFRVWRFGDRGAAEVAVAILVALVVLAPFAIAAERLWAYPQLTDISTDLSDPPVFTAALRERTGAMNPIRPVGAAAAKTEANAYPDIAGRRYGVSLDRAIEAASGVVGEEGWTVTSQPPLEEGAEDYTLEAVARTRLFGLPSDVAIRLTDEGETTYVDMRAVSRYGTHDLGANAGFIRRFFDALDTAMAGTVQR